MSLLRRRMMMLGLEGEEVKELGTVVTNPEDGDYGSLTFSVPYNKGIHYYLLEQTDVVTGNGNRVTAAVLFKCDYVNGFYTIIIESYNRDHMNNAYTTTESSTNSYFIKNEDGTFKIMGASGFQFKISLTYHIYHLIEGKV